VPGKKRERTKTILFGTVSCGVVNIFIFLSPDSLYIFIVIVVVCSVWDVLNEGRSFFYCSLRVRRISGIFK
jgi:hypothetical protein